MYRMKYNIESRLESSACIKQLGKFPGVNVTNRIKRTLLSIHIYKTKMAVAK